MTANSASNIEPRLEGGEKKRGETGSGKRKKKPSI